MEDFLKLFISATFGGLVGIERQISGQSAGFRTQLLVCLGSCLFTILSLNVYKLYGGSSDPGRIAAQIITGIGFLGAGAILRYGKNYIRGLTTAASLWIVSAIGMAVGFGEYLIGGFTTLIVLINLVILKNIEVILPVHRYIDIVVKLKRSDALKFEDIINGYNIKIVNTRFKFLIEQKLIEQEITIRYKDDLQLEGFLNNLKNLPDMTELKIF